MGSTKALKMCGTDELTNGEEYAEKVSQVVGFWTSLGISTV